MNIDGQPEFRGLLFLALLGNEREILVELGHGDDAIEKADAEGKAYEPEVLPNGDTLNNSSPVVAMRSSNGLKNGQIT